MNAHVIERVVPTKIAGVTHYMNFSLNAMEEAAALFGGADAFEKNADSMEFWQVRKILYILTREGDRYMNKFKDGKIETLDEEDFGLLVGQEDIEPLTEAMKKAISAGKERQVEVKPKGKKATATQE